MKRHEEPAATPATETGRREPATDEPGTKQPVRGAPPETARRPAPGVKHEPEPDAENIMPAEDEPGTL